MSIASASASASAMDNSYRYDVFLSFRGVDVRKNFIDHLYKALMDKGIETFKDDEGLEKGRPINELFKFIEEARLYIILFSTNYGSSSWCLKELVKIMECQKTAGRIACPVFYDVEPTEVRNQSGAFGAAFAKQHDKEEVGIWKKSLEEASHLIGWDVRETEDGHEARVIQKIVEEISLKLHSTSVDEDIIGMEAWIKKVESSLAIGSDDVRMIGIKGIGGGGKTTLAKAIYDKVSIHFEGMCFVGNVRERSKSKSPGMESLQKAILSNVLNEKDIEISSVQSGKNMMQNKLRGKKVLVLDDVDHISQLEALAGATNWFKSGSRIIITTRDEQVLARRVKWIHDVSLLSEAEAIILFSRYAFETNVPSQGYEELSQDVIRYASGLPLTIKVLGSSLWGKDKPLWIDKLKRLEKIPCNETLKVLELSYNGLEDDHKEIFLDIACFLKGKWKEDAIRILESCEFNAIYGLDVLVQKSLITINSDGELDMHDRIEEMGRNIVRREHPDEPHKHSRLWIEEEVKDILAKDLGTEATTAISVEWLNSGPDIVSNGFGKMKKRRFLHIDCFFDEITREINLPDTLRYVSWPYYPGLFLSKTLSGNNLVALEMPYSKIVQLWEGGERKVLNKLRFLSLIDARTLKILDLEMTPNLERLDLGGCYRLVELHTHVGCLKRLVYLRLYGCKAPLSFIKHLESLEFLTLGDLPLRDWSDIIPGHSNSKLLELRLEEIDIEELPSSIENLQKLRILHVEDCERLRSLPRSICGLRDLKTLEVTCEVEELPEELGDLECLETLELQSDCIKRLPDSICKLKQLKHLHLSCCSYLEKLPEDLGLLESLEVLELVKCRKIRDVPDSICKLKRLRYLGLSYCGNLEKLPGDFGQLECLEELDITKTCRISDLPLSISLLKDLRIKASEYGYLGYTSEDDFFRTSASTSEDSFFRTSAYTSEDDSFRTSASTSEDSFFRTKRPKIDQNVTYTDLSE